MMIPPDLTGPYFQRHPEVYQPPKPDTSGHPKTAPQPTKKRIKGLLIDLLIPLILLAGWGAVAHYLGPEGAAQSFVDASYRTFDAYSAYSALCPEAQASMTQSRLQTDLDQRRAAFGPANIAGVRFTIVDSNFFAEAHVLVDGAATIGDIATGQVIAFGDPTSDVLTLHASGIGWCLMATNLPLSTSTT
jgi:hypothetical protein